MTHAQVRSSMFCVILASLFAMSCSDQGLNTGQKKTCTKEGKPVEVGQSVPGADGCNSCVCLPDGTFSCTSRDCQPDAAPDLPSDLPPSCVDDGKTYAIGDSFKKDCNTCTCTAQGIACTLMACLPPGGSGGTTLGTGGNRGSGGATAGVAGNRGSGGAVVVTGGAGGSGGSSGTGGMTSPGDAAPQGCTSGGKTYKVGDRFTIDCNECFCVSASGDIACTVQICKPDAAVTEPDGGTACILSANLTFGEDGGNALYWDVNRLTTSTFTITRNYSSRSGRDGSSTSTCSPALPACGASGAVSVATINADLADADVQGLWMLPQNPVPIFGVDDRPVDGMVYSIGLDDGRKILVGRQCASAGMSSCRYIPAGLVRLTEDLRALAKAMRADPVCKGL